MVKPRPVDSHPALLTATPRPILLSEPKPQEQTRVFRGDDRVPPLSGTVQQQPVLASSQTPTIMEYDGDQQKPMIPVPPRDRDMGELLRIMKDFVGQPPAPAMRIPSTVATYQSFHHGD